MTEPLLSLLKRTEATLRAKVAQCSGGATAQFDDRVDQCASWVRNIERWGDVIPKDWEDEMRASCAEWLRMSK
jgi:hypothetical protein